MAKEFADTNQLRINALNEEIRLNRKLAAQERGDLALRMDAISDVWDAKVEIAELEMEDQLRANEVWLDNENAKLAGYLETHKGNAAKIAEQEEQNRIQREANEREYSERIALIHQEFNFKLQKSDEEYEKDWQDIIVDRHSIISESLASEQAERLKVLNDRLAGIRKGGNEEKRILFEIQTIQVEYHNLMKQNQIDQLEWQMTQVETLKEKARILKEIKKLQGEMRSDPADDYENKNSADGMGGSTVDPLFAQDFSKWSSAAQDNMNEMFNIADAIYDHRISLIEKEIEAETAKYDRLLELAKNDEEETKIIQRNKEIDLKRLEDKKRREQIKQAKLQKALNISQAIQSTAVAIVSALATSGPPWVGIAMAALVGAAGAAQIASIAASPIPSFAEGGVMGHDGKALINDGGRQEYVERNGKILATDKTNAVVDLKRGDIIHKDFETLQRKSMLLSLMAGGESISEKELNLAFGIKDEIKQGFKKAQVNSKVTVVNKSDDYRNKMSLWGG